VTEQVKARSANPARLLDFVEPMKAKLVESMPSGGDWIYEIKFDGYRALALRGGNEMRILSRNEKDLGVKFPEVRDSIATLDLQDVIIDGEIVALDEKGVIRPEMVDNWRVSDDKKTYTFTLRDGLTWHDRAKVTAALRTLARY